jgi:hypothetical protein
MHAVLLYAGKGKIKIQKLSKKGKEQMLVTKEMSEKGPERKLAKKEMRWKGPEQRQSKAKRFKRIFVPSVFVSFYNYLFC